MGLAVLATRLTFGGRPNPSKWGMVGETCIDLANAIQLDPNWDPDELFSPSQHLVPKYKPLPDDIPFAQAKELFVNISVNDKGRNDGYIDDSIGIAADLLADSAGEGESENVKRLRAILLSIHILARPGDPNMNPSRGKSWKHSINWLLKPDQRSSKSSWVGSLTLAVSSLACLTIRPLLGSKRSMTCCCWGWQVQRGLRRTLEDTSMLLKSYLWFITFSIASDASKDRPQSGDRPSRSTTNVSKTSSS
jgi:hypothetical protein